jgi:hypothetical protein
MYSFNEIPFLIIPYLQAHIKIFYKRAGIRVFNLREDNFLTETASSGSIDIALSKGG